MKKKYDLIIGIGGNINSKEGLHPIEVGKKAIKKLVSFLFSKILVGEKELCDSDWERRLRSPFRAPKASCDPGDCYRRDLDSIHLHCLRDDFLWVFGRALGS